MKKHMVFLAVIGAPVVVAGGLAIAPAAAQAAYTCGSNQVCIYEGPNFTGSVAVQPALNPGHGYIESGIENFASKHYTNGDNMNDSAASVINNAQQDLLLWRDSGDDGPQVVVSRGTKVNLSNVKVMYPSGAVFTENFAGLASSGRLLPPGE
jgi:hypothetical protein